MSAPFPRWSNSALWASLALLVSLVALVVASPFIIIRSPLVSGEEQQVEQPVKFDHRHHVVDDGIECRYCHVDAERSPRAGVPPIATCMGCHAQIWNGADLLQPVRQSFYANTPFAWRRVHKLPDFVFFDHSAHVRRGVGCVSCHGRVDQMASVVQVNSLQMSWCLDCHRDPDPNLRPQQHITDMQWSPPGDPRAFGAAIRKERNIAPPTNCTSCHR